MREAMARAMCPTRMALKAVFRVVKGGVVLVPLRKRRVAAASNREKALGLLARFPLAGW